MGRYNTICWAVLVAMIGHVLLVASAAPAIIAKPNAAIGLFAVAIIIMGVGTGMFKANISPMIAEQVTNHACVSRAFLRSILGLTRLSSL